MSHHLSAVIQRGIRGIDGKASRNGFIRTESCFKILNEDVSTDRCRLSPPGLLHFVNGVRSRGKFCEYIDSTFCLGVDGPAAVQVHIGCHLSCHQCAAAVKQLNCPAIQGRFIGIADAVTVQIVPFLSPNFSGVYRSGGMQADRAHKLRDMKNGGSGVLTVCPRQRKFAVTDTVVVGKIDGPGAHDRGGTAGRLDRPGFVDM